MCIVLSELAMPIPQLSISSYWVYRETAWRQAQLVVFVSAHMCQVYLMVHGRLLSPKRFNRESNGECTGQPRSGGLCCFKPAQKNAPFFSGSGRVLLHKKKIHHPSREKAQQVSTQIVLRMLPFNKSVLKPAELAGPARDLHLSLSY